MTSSRCVCRHAGNAPSRSVSGIKLARGPPVIMIASVMFYALYPLSRLIRRVSGKKLTVLQHEHVRLSMEQFCRPVINADKPGDCSYILSPSGAVMMMGTPRYFAVGIDRG